MLYFCWFSACFAQFLLAREDAFAFGRAAPQTHAVEAFPFLAVGAVDQEALSADGEAVPTRVCLIGVTGIVGRKARIECLAASGRTEPAIATPIAAAASEACGRRWLRGRSPVAKQRASETFCLAIALKAWVIICWTCARKLGAAVARGERASPRLGDFDLNAVTTGGDSPVPIQQLNFEYSGRRTNRGARRQLLALRF